MKTGYTKRSLHSLVAAATRNGRTMIAVILNHPGETYTPASALLDKGFATPVEAQSGAGRLPPVPVAGGAVRATAEQASSSPANEQAAGAGAPLAAASASTSRGLMGGLAAFLFKVLLGVAAVVAILRIRVRTMAAQHTAARRRGRRGQRRDRSSRRHRGPPSGRRPLMHGHDKLVRYGRGRRSSTSRPRSTRIWLRASRFSCAPAKWCRRRARSTVA